MKVLLDECTPVQVKNSLEDHEVATAPKMGWSSLSNGDLLNAAEMAGFELFIIADKNLRYQQNLVQRRIAILELWTNHRPTLEKHFDRIREAVSKISPGDIQGSMRLDTSFPGEAQSRFNGDRSRSQTEKI